MTRCLDCEQPMPSLGNRRRCAARRQQAAVRVAAVTRRPCAQCCRRTVSTATSARFCRPCAAARREVSRTRTADDVEQRLAAARAARLAEERRTGRRRFTVDPWEQKAGRSTIDADCAVWSVR